MKHTYLVTGVAGFIGSFVAQRLCADGHLVIGVDNLNNYYDPALKHGRLAGLQAFPNFIFIKLDLADRAKVATLFAEKRFDRVIHLAAQTGVRYSLENPFAYVDSNLTGMMTILEGCRHNGVKHLVYASSSSIYGMNTKMPFATTDSADHPVSLYAATKKSNELLAHSYSHLYGLPTTGLRFFTVYGPWGRPDMAPFLFTRAITEGRPIQVFNQGNMLRDFTYIEDIVEGVVRIQNVIPQTDPDGDMSSPDKSTAPYRIYNIGNNEPVTLSRFINAIELAAGKSAIKEYLPMQPGDVPATYADISGLSDATGFWPATTIEEGMQRFVDWYKGFYDK